LVLSERGPRHAGWARFYGQTDCRALSVWTCRACDIKLSTVSRNFG